MNQLSWILYWADVLPAFSSAVGTVTALLAVAGFVVLTIHLFATAFADDDDEAAAVAKATWPSRWLFPLMVVLCWTTYLIPSRETFYAIAVSEAGEQVLKTPEVGKARQALNAWLDKQIKPAEQPNPPAQ